RGLHRRGPRSRPSRRPHDRGCAAVRPLAATRPDGPRGDGAARRLAPRRHGRNRHLRLPGRNRAARARVRGAVLAARPTGTASLRSRLVVTPIEDARVAIIGGGVAGCSLAYHLAKLGCDDVVLLEQAELTSGSTWHSAGLCTQFSGSWSLMRTLRASVEGFAELEADTG